MQKFSILWADDEIDLLKPHRLVLEQKGYKVFAAQSGQEGLELLETQHVDIVFLDENMPGLSGLDTLLEIKQRFPNLPVVMITKNEEEMVMESAIGSKIADYILKPVEPKHLILCLKKNLDHSRLISEKTTASYQQEFRQIAVDLSMTSDHEEWIALYKKLVYWERELEGIEDSGMSEILESQKTEANNQFFKFVEKSYLEWIQKAEGPILSHQLFREWVVPELKASKVLFILIDNLRYDQWLGIQESLGGYYRVREDRAYYSILPTATQYARNAIFSGLLPLDMQNSHPDWWKNDTDEGGKNLHEKEFLGAQLARLGLDISWEYHKISNLKQGRQLSQQFSRLQNNDLSVVVYNFVDMLSHAKTEMEVIRELAPDDKAYRSLTMSWFRNSPLLQMIQQARDLGMKLIITTDHGTINVKQPSKVIGDRETSLNLRYKTGRSLTYSDKEVFAIRKPALAGLPSIHMSSSFIFVKNDLFFAYPNNYNHYVGYYRNTYQHGGVSLEEMIVPFAILEPK